MSFRVRRLWVGCVAVLTLTLYACQAFPTAAPSQAEPSPQATQPTSAATPEPSDATPAPSIAVGVTCEDPPVSPTTTLTCAGAVAAAVLALPSNHPAIEGIQFFYGAWCPPGARCGYVSRQHGYVVFTTTSPASQLYIPVVASDGGTVTVIAGPAPFPPA